MAAAHRQGLSAAGGTDAVGCPLPPSPDLRLEHRLPIVTRWTLYAMGAVEGQRVRRPRDPVAAWLLRRHPKLMPTFAAPSILSMLRARSSMVDERVASLVTSARVDGESLSYWSLGGGFDARWYRLQPVLESLDGHYELEDPEVMAFKHEVLATSTFAGHWQGIERTVMQEREWTIPTTNRPVLVVLEGVAVRLGLPGLESLLQRIRADAPRATVLVDLPGILQGHGAQQRGAVAVGSARSRWMSAKGTGAAALGLRTLKRLGWQVQEDVWMSARPELRAPSGMPICSGTEAFRLLTLRAM